MGVGKDICAQLDAGFRFAQLTGMVAPLTNKSVLRIAVPVMLSNMSEPMIGVVNTAVMGRLPSPHFIGGISVSALIFAFLFWGFSFLRHSTSGLSAQATGAGDGGAVAAVFWRSVTLAIGIGFVLLALGPWLGPIAVGLVGGSPAVMREAQIYFDYRILSAPAALCNFAILGWLIGQGRAMASFATQLLLNLSNMALSALFVLGLQMETRGVGLAVVIAEYAAVAAGFAIALPLLRKFIGARERIFDLAKFKSLIAANADIMIRTFCLVFAFGWFTARGARAGDLIIAANAVLLNLFEVAAYMIDGFANAAESLVGQAIGAQNKPRYVQAIKLTSLWALVFGGVASIAIWLGGPQLISLLTTNAEIKATALAFLPWAALTPLLGTVCFQLDGIFIGALATREMRNMMVLSVAIYLAAWWVLEARFGNHGLWAALCVLFVARGISFAWQMPAITGRVFSSR